MWAMKFISDIEKNKSLICSSIKKYGYAPEHNFEWYKIQKQGGAKSIFVLSKDKTGLLTIEDGLKKTATVFSLPLAPASKRVKIIIEYISKVLAGHNIQKVIFELEESLYKNLLFALPKEFKANRINYTLVWPVYNLTKFDVSLAGGQWKTLRKVKNRFYKNHQVKFTDAKKYLDKNSLIGIIERWHKNRSGNDRTNRQKYIKYIEDNFEGATEARVLIVDGRAVGINAGWKIPNSDRFYGAIGIGDYSLADLGDMLYFEDLVYLKKQGYAKADMGGGEAALTDFKNKFKPESYYKTHIFSIVKT